MSKPYSEEDLSDLFDGDLIWRRKELSDMKAAARAADPTAKHALIRAIIAMSYAHWEGYVRYCANRYFEYLTIRKPRFSQLERQIYVNAFLVRLKTVAASASFSDRCKLINDILDGNTGSFRYINPELIDTRSNLDTDTVKEICLVCAVSPKHFEDKRSFIDQLIVKRRNAIAHGQQEFAHEDEMDDLVADTLALMMHFRTLLENKVYSKAYLRGP